MCQVTFIPFNSACDLGEKRDGKGVGGLASMETWNVHLNFTFFIVFYC